MGMLDRYHGRNSPGELSRKLEIWGKHEGVE